MAAMKTVRAVVWAASVSLLLATAPAAAQDEGMDDEETLIQADPEAGLGDEPEAQGELDDGPAPVAGGSSTPQPLWASLYFRMPIVPAFMLELLLDSAPTIVDPAFGATFARRSDDGFSWQLGLGYSSYSFEGPFRAKNDPDQDTEWLESDLGLLHLTGSMLWSTSFLDGMLALEYGIGLDIGIVLGELRRSEARALGNGEYEKCQTPGWQGDFVYCATNPTGGTAAYDENGEHYNVVEENVPPAAVVPMLPHLALRFVPHERVQIKLEFAYSVFQFWWGMSAGFGFGA